MSEYDQPSIGMPTLRALREGMAPVLGPAFTSDWNLTTESSGKYRSAERMTSYAIDPGA